MNERTHPVCQPRHHSSQSYWVGLKGHLGFSVNILWRSQRKFLDNLVYNTASFYSYASFVLAKDIPREVCGQQCGTGFEERPVLGKATLWRSLIGTISCWQGWEEGALEATCHVSLTWSCSKVTTPPCPRKQPSPWQHTDCRPTPRVGTAHPGLSSTICSQRSPGISGGTIPSSQMRKPRLKEKDLLKVSLPRKCYVN